MSEVVDERQLIQCITSGDRQALVKLYVRYQRPLFHYLLQLTPDRGLAEELLQDTLFAVWKSAHTFEGRSSVSTWLFGIARRQAHNTLRRRGLPLVSRGDLELALLADCRPQPDDFVLANAVRDDLQRAMANLPPIYREVLVLAFVQDQSYLQMAEIVGVPVGTIKSRLYTAKHLLRQLLVEMGKVTQ